MPSCEIPVTPGPTAGRHPPGLGLGLPGRAADGADLRRAAAAGPGSGAAVSAPDAGLIGSAAMVAAGMVAWLMVDSLKWPLDRTLDFAERLADGDDTRCGAEDERRRVRPAPSMR